LQDAVAACAATVDTRSSYQPLAGKDADIATFHRRS